MPRKKKSNLEPEIENKLTYIGLDLDNVPQNVTKYEPLNFRIPKTYDEKQYKQYRYVPIKNIQILISPTNRLEELQIKYIKAHHIPKHVKTTKHRRNTKNRTRTTKTIKQNTI